MGVESFSPPYRIHLGCDTMKFDGFVNVEVRKTEAADVVHDCSNLSIFPDETALLVFSHTFYARLYRGQHVPLLTDIRRVLHSDGCLFFCGIPDFEMISRAYLERAPGNVSTAFDLFEVYRYTHGDPEQRPEWWLAHLYKSLFDAEELRVHLREAGFAAPRIFRYAFREQPNPVNLGFVAMKNNQHVSDEFMRAIINMFSPIYGTNPIAMLPD
jgi:predicted SAM-dependent methyltransferase